MRMTLCLTVGKVPRQTIAVTQFPFVIGRGDECDLRLRFPYVSRHHCELILEQSRVVVRDLDSCNGTFVNEDRIAFERELVNGDVLSFGFRAHEVLIDEISTNDSHGGEHAKNGSFAA